MPLGASHKKATQGWGYVSAPTPERTMQGLEAILPRRYWIEINALLVPFGKDVCTGALWRAMSVLTFIRPLVVLEESTSHSPSYAAPDRRASAAEGCTGCEGPVRTFAPYWGLRRAIAVGDWCRNRAIVGS